MSRAAAEADRQIAAMIQMGQVLSVDEVAVRAAVRVGDIDVPAVAIGQASPPVRWSFWWLPQVGDQVVVLCPGGDMARAVIVCAIYAGNAPSSDGSTPLIDVAGGTIRLNGNLEVTGGITTTDDVVAGGISLITHIHPGVDPGPGNTGEPA